MDLFAEVGAGDCGSLRPNHDHRAHQMASGQRENIPRLDQLGAGAGSIGNITARGLAAKCPVLGGMAVSLAESDIKRHLRGRGGSPRTGTRRSGVRARGARGPGGGGARDWGARGWGYRTAACGRQQAASADHCAARPVHLVPAPRASPAELWRHCHWTFAFLSWFPALHAILARILARPSQGPLRSSAQPRGAPCYQRFCAFRRPQIAR
jgi:hypothetical protein